MCSGPFSCHSQVEVLEFRCFRLCMRCLVVLERNYCHGSSIHANPRNLFLCCIYCIDISSIFRTFSWVVLQVSPNRISSCCLMHLKKGGKYQNIYLIVLHLLSNWFNLWVSQSLWLEPTSLPSWGRWWPITCLLVIWILHHSSKWVDP